MVQTRYERTHGGLGIVRISVDGFDGIVLVAGERVDVYLALDAFVVSAAKAGHDVRPYAREISRALEGFRLSSAPLMTSPLA